MVKLRFISLGSDDSTLILDPVEAPSVLAALGLIDAQLCRLCGSSATLGDDPPFDLLACLAALKKPGDSFEHRNDLFPDEGFELIFEPE
ncbi:MAG: hypothetical protein KGS60_07780 [Verrucomicrobia bacterium]|nr:hypothetical protein [Verrucomicrobiota bacterium]